MAKGPFAATWDSLSRYNVAPWYLDAKFGIFIHWGVYSVPAFESEWYPRNMYLKESLNSSTTSRPSARNPVRLQEFHPAIQGREI